MGRRTPPRSTPIRTQRRPGGVGGGRGNDWSTGGGTTATSSSSLLRPQSGRSSSTAYSWRTRAAVWSGSAGGCGGTGLVGGAARLASKVNMISSSIRGVHLQQQALRRRDGKEARVDGEGGVDEGLADSFAPFGHAHLRILRRNVCRSGLVPAVGAGIHVALLKCALALCLSRQSIYIHRKKVKLTCAAVGRHRKNCQPFRHSSTPHCCIRNGYLHKYANLHSGFQKEACNCQSECAD